MEIPMQKNGGLKTLYPNKRKGPNTKIWHLFVFFKSTMGEITNFFLTKIFFTN